MKRRPASFVNWAKNIKSGPQQYLQPETEEEIIEIVRKYPKIRMVGSGHSWSDICATDGVNINLDYYNKILHIDKENAVVHAQAGIKMWQLNKLLGLAGLAIENQGSIDHQSIAGAVSTGTHGSGINFQILGKQIIEFTLIKADGRKVIVNRNENPDLYHACVVNLGALGIISEVKIQAVPAFNLHDVTAAFPFEEIIDNLDEFLYKTDHFKLWWLSPSHHAVAYRYQRTEEKANDSRLRRYFKDKVFSVAAYRSIVLGSRLFPHMTVAFNRFLTAQIKPLERIEEACKVFIVPEPPLHLETEWAFDASNAKEILREYRQMLIDSNSPMSFIQEVRFTKGDDCWLSGCYGRDTLWLGLYCFKHEKWSELLKRFEVFAQKHKGRPHWGKIFNVGPDYLRKQYPKFDDFVGLQKEMDPEGKFINTYLERALGIGR